MSAAHALFRDMWQREPGALRLARVGRIGASGGSIFGQDEAMSQGV